MHKNDNIPKKMWFSFNDLKNKMKRYGKELTDKDILESAVFYATKEENSKISKMKFHSPQRIQLFLRLRDPISAAVKHDVDGEQKHFGTVTLDEFMPLSDCYVENYLNLDLTKAIVKVSEFVFATTGTGPNKELWPKYQTIEPLEIGYADFCVIDSKHTIHLNKDTINCLFVHRADVIKLFKKYRKMEKKVGGERIRLVINTGPLNLTHSTVTDDELTASNTPVLGLPLPNDASNNTQSTQFSPQSQVPDAHFLRIPKGHPAEKYGEFKAWLWRTWVKNGRKPMNDFFPILEIYVKQKGSPIREFRLAGESAGVDYRLSTGAERSINKDHLRNRIGEFKKADEKFPPQ